MTLEDLTRAIEKICTVSGADIRAVLYAMVDVAVDSLSNGTIVRKGDMCSFRVSIRSVGCDKADEVVLSVIKGSYVLFNPGPRIKTMMGAMKYQKK